MLRSGVLLSLLAASFAVSIYRIFSGFADIVAINRAQDRIIQDVQIWANKLNANGIDPSYLFPVDQPSYSFALISIMSGGIFTVLTYVLWCENFLIFRNQVANHEKLCKLNRAAIAVKADDAEDYDAAMRADDKFPNIH